MTSSGFFRCNKCGHCCRTLLERQYDGKVFGLALLTSEEKELFDEDDVLPKTATGKEEPREILSHQLKHNVCPHINSNNECSIYSKRPLACKAYPITSTIGRNKADLKCPEVSKYSAYELSNVVFADEFDEAMTRINMLIENALKKRRGDQRLWVFDIATEKWYVLSKNSKY